MMITYHFKNILPQNHIKWLIILKNKKQKVTREEPIYDTAPLIAVTNFLQSNSFTILTFSHTYTQNHPSLPAFSLHRCRSSWTTTEGEGGRERTRGNKRGRGVSGDNSPTSPSSMVCAVMSTHNAFFTFTVNNLMKSTCLCNTFSCQFV